jgi:hypothetical protein
VFYGDLETLCGGWIFYYLKDPFLAHVCGLGKNHRICTCECTRLDLSMTAPFYVVLLYLVVINVMLHDVDVMLHNDVIRLFDIAIKLNKIRHFLKF